MNGRARLLLVYRTIRRTDQTSHTAAQATTPWTLLEAGWNCNHTKDLIRILRDGGTLAGDRSP